MSVKFKVIAIALIAVLMIGVTTMGVWTADKIYNGSFGMQVKIAMDRETDSGESVGVVNFLILGVDEEQDRSDTMMLASVDGYSKRVSILSIPRDTRVRFGGNYEKINAALAIGKQEVEAGRLDEPEELVIEKVKGITGLPIHYFFTINFDAFKEIVDLFGGVDFNVPYDMDYDDPVQDLHIHFEKGQQHLDGQAAHDFVRYRHDNDGSAPGEYVYGDLGRVHWQQEFVKEFIRQKLNPQYISKVSELFEVIEKNVRTNYTMSDLMKHIGLASQIAFEDIKMYQIPGDSEYIDGLWWFSYDDEKTDELVNEYFIPMTEEEWAAKKQEDAAAAAASPSPSPQKTDDDEGE